MSIDCKFCFSEKEFKSEIKKHYHHHKNYGWILIPETLVTRTIWLCPCEYKVICHNMILDVKVKDILKDKTV